VHKIKPTLEASHGAQMKNNLLTYPQDWRILINFGSDELQYKVFSINIFLKPGLENDALLL
jgi:hypothetical protein